MGVYDNAIAMAIRLISKKGQSVTWQQLVKGAPIDPQKPWKYSTALKTPVTVTIVFLPDNKENRQSIRYITGTEVQTGSEVGLMTPVSFTPKIGDVVIRDGEQITIKNVTILRPNGKVVLYFLEFEL